MADVNMTNDEELDDIVTLTLDDGTEMECFILGIFDFEEKDYIALAPTTEDSEDIFLYGYKEVNEDDFELIDIEDDDEFDRVAAEFEKLAGEIEE